MEQRKEITSHYIAKGLCVGQAVLIAGISKSTYYHKRTGNKKGKRPSTSCMYNGKLISNTAVVDRIMELIEGDDFLDYGYQRTHQQLRKEGYQINHKKVYRLMKEAKLLYPSIKTTRGFPRTFVKYTTPAYTSPFATIEVDLKYVFIHGANKHAYLVTFLDTFTRMAVAWDLGYRMTNDMIGELIKQYVSNEIVAPYLQYSKIKLRSDNGPQFISRQLANSIKHLPIDQEFIRPGTPQQNGHIESFHNTVRKLVTDRYNFTDLMQAREIFKGFYQSYNHKRIMKAILHCSPSEFLQKWKEGQIGITTENRKQKFFFRERQSPS